MRFDLPYDRKTVPVEIDDRNFVGSLVSKVESYKPVGSPQKLVEASLDHPIGSPKLEELVKGKKNIVIISSDHTRPVPSKIITPILLRRIRAAQRDANIKILVATGFHRPSTHLCRQSFPRKRESSGRLDSLEPSNSRPDGLVQSGSAILAVWIPASAGMTTLQMTPVSVGALPSPGRHVYASIIGLKL
jgi:hypothetical protein